MKYPAVLLTLIILSSTFQAVLSQNRIDITGPEGSKNFGNLVEALPNGNFVVTDPGYSIPDGPQNVGAAYLFDGFTRRQISMITGSREGDLAFASIHVLDDGNYVVANQNWRNEDSIRVGAVTWCSSTVGCSGKISAENSLVGGSFDDQVYQVQPLPGGAYLVLSPFWDRGSVQDAGAVTFCKFGGCRGQVSISNSLVGSQANDRVGKNTRDQGILLATGNFLIHSAYWSNGSAVRAGAVTFCNMRSTCVGEISERNSLVGTSSHDSIGSRLSETGIFVLPNGNYVVSSPYWSNGQLQSVGAATFGSGMTGISGNISSTNSLVGSSEDDRVGANVTPLESGNYVVSTPGWNNGSVPDVGAYTFGTGQNGVTGTVSTANSLIGKSARDAATDALFSVFPLKNGDYVIVQKNWDNETQIDAGAVTYCDGRVGTYGHISPANSFVGNRSNDRVGSGGVLEVAGGNIVVLSPEWDEAGSVNVGAATFLPKNALGTVSRENSLVGSSENDRVGGGASKVLSNGNYVVLSSNWQSGGVAVGAATFGNGDTGVRGSVSRENSLVGTSAGDMYGSWLYALPNGNYVLAHRAWDNGGEVDAGAFTFGNGKVGISGAISSANSLVGARSNDCSGSVDVLTNANYVVNCPLWDNGLAVNAGSVTFGNGNTGVSGEISAVNSLVGATSNDSGFRILEVPGGNFLVQNGMLDNGPIQNAGSITFGDGVNGVSGIVSKENSLIGSVPQQRLGSSVIVTNGRNGYLAINSYYSLGNNIRSGGIVYGDFRMKGTVESNYNILGTVADGGLNIKAVYDSRNDQFVIGRDKENVVSILRFGERIDGRVLSTNGQPLRNARVTLTNSIGEKTSVITGSFGGFSFEDVVGGNEYLLSVDSKRYRFQAQRIVLQNSITGIEMVGIE